MPLRPEASKKTETATKTESIHSSAPIMFTKTAPKYSFADMILAETTLNELHTVVSAQQNWKKVFQEWGLATVLKERKNLYINLYGESGTGKTMAAHALASELHKNLVCVNYAEIESKYVGETNKNLSALFTDPTNMNEIIFFDEADALLSKRVTNMSNSTDVSVNQTRSHLLTLLNSYEGMVIFATNFISNYDPAFMRRIQYHIRFDLPNYDLRLKLWRHYIPKQMPVNVNFEVLAASDNLSGSDISTAVLKAALSAARKQQSQVLENDFIDAIQSVQAAKESNRDDSVITRTRVVDESEVPEDVRRNVKYEKNDSE